MDEHDKAIDRWMDACVKFAAACGIEGFVLCAMRGDAIGGQSSAHKGLDNADQMALHAAGAAALASIRAHFGDRVANDDLASQEPAGHA